MTEDPGGERDALQELIDGAYAPRRRSALERTAARARVRRRLGERQRQLRIGSAWGAAAAIALALLARWSPPAERSREWAQAARGPAATRPWDEQVLDSPRGIAAANFDESLPPAYATMASWLADR